MKTKQSVSIDTQETLTVKMDIAVSPWDVPEGAIVVLSVNGRHVRTMNVFQARRMGLIREEGQQW